MDEEVIFATLPCPSVTGQASAGNDAVDMRMVHQILAPGVQDADKPDRSSKMFRICSKFCQGFRNSFEQKTVEDFLIPEHKGIELIGESEDHVEVRDGKQIFFPGLYPLLFFKKLALGAVPVSAGVVRDNLVAAVLALINMAALLRGAAGFDRPHGAQTIQGHGMGVPVQRTVLSEDIPNFDLSAISRVHGGCRACNLQGLRRV
jgi:hypothetical protein